MISEYFPRHISLKKIDCVIKPNLTLFHQSTVMNIITPCFISKRAVLGAFLFSVAALSLSGQTVEKLQPINAGSAKYTFDISLPLPDTVKSIDVSADGKPVPDNGKLDFDAIDDVNNDYTCNVLFLVDKAAGGGTTSAENDTKAFQSLLKRLIDTASAKNRNRQVTREQSAKQGLSTVPSGKIPVLYNIEVSTLEGAAYQKLASTDSNQSTLDQAIETINLNPGSQLISRGLRNVITEFQTMPADRKFIVLVSTGRFTDHSTSLDDVVRAAKDSGIKICTIGFNDGRGDEGLNSMVYLAGETQGLALATDRVNAAGEFPLAEEKLDDLLAYMVAGAKGTVDLAGIQLPTALRFNVNTAFGKVYVVDQKIEARPEASPALAATPPTGVAPTSTPASPALPPSTNAAPASVQAPSTNAPTAVAPSTNAAPVKPSVRAPIPAAADKPNATGALSWIQDEYKNDPLKIGAIALGILVLIFIGVVLVVRLRRPAPEGTVTFPANAPLPYTQAPGDPSPEPTVHVAGDAPSSSDAPVMAWLENTQGDDRYPIRSKSVRIGRKADNDIVLNDNSVSNYHAEIIKRDGKFIIVDRGSSNKVYISGRPVHNVPLNEGDVLELGDIRLRFQVNNN